jgi:quinol monooxygenase YgiN
MTSGHGRVKVAGLRIERRRGRLLALLALASSWLLSCATNSATRAPGDTSRQDDVGKLVRLSELEIEPAFLNEYLSILRTEAAASVQLEPGVLAIVPMQEQQRPTQIRIVEIYASRAAYEAHLQTPHFKHYKNTTLHMVRSLRLADMTALDLETMPVIFRKWDR